ncbi:MULTISPECIES: cytochrome c5 family protein [unclassified Idiomarina]|uniref:c-type cytochrome n=1 Tax=unclassified Idiomarina TaxID=2614829 RepID=UPI0009F23826|nr:cytochrome c5 family protein [Idiomarinaceae bacterium]
MKRLTTLALKSLSFGLAAMISFGASAAVQDDMSKDAIAKRIEPIGKIRVAGESAASEAAASGPRSGEAVFGQYCTACHTSGVMGAPKINNADDWEPRLAQGMDTVLKHAINGFNAMPPKGTCADCSDDEIKAAIEYMTAEI